MDDYTLKRGHMLEMVAWLREQADHAKHAGENDLAEHLRVAAQHVYDVGFDGVVDG